jgi:secernin
MSMSNRRIVVLVAFTVLLAFCWVTDASACDTFVALGNSTADGSVIFAKASCRHDEENMHFASYPGGTHQPGEMVKCSWIEIPQAPVTYAVKGGQPWWGYGFEMGMNEFGVCAGNELLESKIPVPNDMLDTSLNGMDLLRLGLERGKTAYEAMHVVISLLEKYGQFGRCTGDTKTAYTYANSFLFADPNEAWVLETGGYEWIAKKVTTTWTINNVATIEDDYDEISPGLIKMALDNKWYDSRDRFNWTLNMTPEVNAEIKYLRVRDMLKTKKGNIDVPFMMQITRDRLEGTFMQGRYMPAHYFEHVDYTCWGWSTAGAIVCSLRKDVADPLKNVMWICEASPTTSPFSPHYFISDPPKELAIGDDQYDADVPWWIFDTLDRMSRKNYELYTPVIRTVWDVEEKGLFVDTSMIEKEVSRLYAKGEMDKIKALLTDFESKNLKHQVEVAKAIAAAIKELHKVLPGRYVPVEDHTESSDLKAGIELW